jgi:hypothetical protein
LYKFIKTIKAKKTKFKEYDQAILRTAFFAYRSDKFYLDGKPYEIDKILVDLSKKVRDSFVVLYNILRTYFTMLT